jgi:adenylate cyclase
MSGPDVQQASEGSDVYRIAIDPVEGCVRVFLGGLEIANSTRAMLLRETHFPRYCYLPKADLIDGLLEPSTFRTFCPFKGTASFWNLKHPGGTVEKGAWSYEKPLQEARPLGGYVAFDPSAVDEILTEPRLPEPEVDLIGGRPLIDWVVRKAWRFPTPSKLTEQFAQQLLASGIPLWRLSINLWTLHPEIAGQRFTWMRGAGGVVASDTPHGLLQSPAYRNSPVRFVSEGLGGVRQRLDIDNPEFQFPIFEELRANGGTDYVAMPLPFSDGRFQTMSLATDDPEGFTTAQLGQIFEIFGMLGRIYEVLTLRRDTAVLFETYLGQRTGRQVLGGQTRRGAGQVIRAAILYCDLRNSSALTGTLSRTNYLNLLNDFFERVVDPVLTDGGEVLKFIGDAVLAIFPLDQSETDEEQICHACRKAREVAQAIVARVAEAPVYGEGLSVQCAIGVHFGDVMYGNIGASKRLDFTVTGQAANIAARLSGLCKELGQPLLLSGEVACRAPDGLNCLGHRTLRNVDTEHEVFAVAGTDFG